MGNYLIIGGSSGVGLEVVNQLSEAGHNVLATYNTTEVTTAKQNVSYTKLDVLSDIVDEQLLPEEVNGLVYCPGSINLKPFHRFKEDDFIQDYKVQVLGAAKIIQQLLPRLKKSENASIVLFSTVAVDQGFNFHSQVAMSKGAIQGLTKSLAAEFAPSIRVNAVAPSLTNTPLAARLLNTPEKIATQSQLNPMKRVGTATDIASTVIFLLSHQASWVTGQILHVDGGFSSIK